MSGIRSCAHWLNWKCGIAIGAAREKVRVARCLEGLPKINEAFATGAISYSKVRAMIGEPLNKSMASLAFRLTCNLDATLKACWWHVEKLQRRVRVSLNAPKGRDLKYASALLQTSPMTTSIGLRLAPHIYILQVTQRSHRLIQRLPEVATLDNEDYLLMIAQYGTASHVEKLVQKVQRVESLDKPNIEQSLQDAREFSSYQDDDGMWVIRAKLPPEVGSLVIKAIDEIVRASENDKNVPAETSEPELFSNSNYDDSEENSFPMRKADALAVMAEHYLASAEDGVLSGSERCQVMLHVDIDTLKKSNRHSHATSSANCHVDGQWISPTTAKRLCCDASLVTVLEDGCDNGKGNVLNIGRRSRIIPPSIARALSVRDTTCRYPGCCSTKYLDAHHIQHWADGGETKLDNLVTLCRHHHRLLHQGLFEISANDSTVVFANSVGESIEKSFFPQFAKNVPAETLQDYFIGHFPAVNEQTAISYWAGESMDYGMAVDGVMGL